MAYNGLIQTIRDKFFGKYSFGARKNVFPFVGNEKRIVSYDFNQKLYYGDHLDLFGENQNLIPGKDLYFVTVNLSKLIVDTIVDFVFSSVPVYTMPVDNQKSAEALKNIIQWNEYWSVWKEMLKTSIGLGDGVMKLRLGKKTPNNEKEIIKPIIESVHPSTYYPTINQDNNREVTEVKFCWIRYITSVNEKEPKPILRVEIHEVGKIYQKAYEVKPEGSQWIILQEIDINSIPEYAQIEAEQETGLDIIPVWHYGYNRFSGQHWGKSIFHNMESLFESLDGNTSHIDTILDKHADPKPILPDSMRSKLLNKNGTIDKDNFEVLFVDDAEASKDIPRYMQFMSSQQMQSMFDQIEQTIQFILIQCRTSETAIGYKSKRGESGEALKQRLLNTLLHVGSIKEEIKPMITDILYYAQVLDTKKGEGKYTPAQPSIVRWNVNLPDDAMDQAIIDDKRSAGKATKSIEQIVKDNNPEWNQEQVNMELEKIIKDNDPNAEAVNALMGVQTQ